MCSRIFSLQKKKNHITSGEYEPFGKCLPTIKIHMILMWISMFQAVEWFTSASRLSANVEIIYLKTALYS